VDLKMDRTIFFVNILNQYFRKKDKELYALHLQFQNIILGEKE